jgi:hypothetical protein
VTGIVILPQRNPVVLAKEVASLDVLSSVVLMQPEDGGPERGLHPETRT